MECKIIRKLSLVFIIGVMLLSSCYYDNYDDLATAPNACDTLDMSYTSNVSPIMTDNCVSCHSGGAPAGNIPLETYSEVKVQADNGKLLGSIKHEAGYSPMPKNQSQLSECDVNKIEAWINQGTKN
jgi:hypothetical protein